MTCGGRALVPVVHRGPVSLCVSKLVRRSRKWDEVMGTGLRDGSPWESDQVRDRPVIGRLRDKVQAGRGGASA